MLPDILVGDDIEKGRLVPLLPNHPMEARPWSLVFPSRHLQSTSVKCFIETALEAFGQFARMGGE